MAYDFVNLSPADFEDLSRDLIGRSLGIRFEAFGPGPDGGYDGRHASSAGTIALQAKHYAGSDFRTLRRAIAKERKAIDKIAPSRYILSTSRALTPNNKTELKKIIGAHLLSTSDIFSAGDLNALLRAFPNIERAHVKLWLSSTVVLDRIVRAASHTVAAIAMDEIVEKLRVYASNDSLPAAKTKLEENHVLIISGPPGVGKTTLAEMLSYAYIAEEWDLVVIRTLEDGFASIRDNEKQVFLFDDFLGRVELDRRALASRDSDIYRFIKRVSNSKNARFILTTRAYILEDARRVSEYLSDDLISVSKFVLDVGSYTRSIRARILYNHLVVNKTPRDYIEALLLDSSLKEIVDHPNYNPRVISWMTDGLNVRRIPADQYPATFKQNLQFPNRIWDTAFRTHISPSCRHLLLCLFFESEYRTKINIIRPFFQRVHAELCRRYNISHDMKDFEDSIRILEGSFIAIGNSSIWFINPSVRDYIKSYLVEFDMIEMFARLANSGLRASRIWQHGKTVLNNDELRKLAGCFTQVAALMETIPIWRQSSDSPATYVIGELSNSARIELLLEWWGATTSEDFAEHARRVAEAPPEGFRAWQDGTRLVSLLVELQTDTYEELPHGLEIATAVESALVSLLEGGIASDDLEGVSDAIAEARHCIPDSVVAASYRAIRNEIQNVDVYAAETDSTSTLEDHRAALERLADRAGVPSSHLDEALSVIDSRINELTEAAEDAAPPSFTYKAPPKGSLFDDADLRNLFLPLLSK